MMDCDALGALRRSSLFSLLPQADLALLANGAVRVDLIENTILFHTGEEAGRIWVIVSGEVMLLSKAPAGLIRLGPGDTAGEEAALMHTCHTATARVTLPGTAFSLPAAALTSYLEANFQVAIAMISAMAGYLRAQVREITDLKIQSTAERLAGYLVSLAGDATGRTVVRLPCEKRHLADHLGMDPATLSRAFAKLRDKGVTANRSDKVVIGDVAALRSFGDCAALSA
jgi:CRP/FNR family transcriptional regulator, dissimilatory nitrate respiration regulator